MFLKLYPAILLMSQNLVGVGDCLCFHCLEACFVSGYSDEPRSHHSLQSCPASPLLLSCSTVGCQEMSSFAWPAVPALAVLAPIEQTPSETWDDCGWFCAPNLVKYRCAEQSLKLTRAGRTVRKHQLWKSWHRSSQQHADQVVPYQQCFLCREQTSYTKHVLLVSGCFSEWIERPSYVSSWQSLGTGVGLNQSQVIDVSHKCHM